MVMYSRKAHLLRSGQSAVRYLQYAECDPQIVWVAQSTHMHMHMPPERASIGQSPALAGRDTVGAATLRRTSGGT